MKWCRRFLPLSALAVAGVAVSAGLPQWLQHTPSLARLEGVLFRMASMPGGDVPVRRAPQEARAKLTELIGAAPAEVEFYALRGRVSEEQLDFAAAEQDWKKFAELSPDKGAGQLALADFYHRRLRPADEIRALDAAAAQGPMGPLERYRPAHAQRSWGIFERALELVEAHALPLETGMAQYRAWIARYPKEESVYQQYLEYLATHKQFPAAAELVGTYQKAFPEDTVFPIAARARIEESRGSVDQALAVYDRAFDPLWPSQLVKDYFGLLERTHNLRRFLERARSGLAANPNDLNAAVRVFYYYQQQGNLPAAHRALIEFRLKKEARKAQWTAQDYWVPARLFEATQQYGEAIRSYYGMYALNPAGAESERALAGVIRVLFTAPEQPLRFGAGDLSMYKDIGTMDPYPGFLNGILSLILNSTSPAWKYADEDRNAVPYFHRVRAAELLALFDSKYPKSDQRAVLHAQLLQAYATHGDSDGVIRAGRQFLTAFPQAGERTDVAMLMADAFARKNDPAQEFLTYDALLKELAARADGVPLGEGGPAKPAKTTTDEEGVEHTEEAAPTARSADYSRVLERYISRLVALKRPLDALKLLRGELDRNPNDPGLYERLAAFIEQNKLGAEVEQVYRRAIQQFGGTSWHDKLARWYVRRKQTSALNQLTRDVTGVFSGTDLEKYFAEIVSRGSVGRQAYVQLNLYAHQRFPNDLVFVHNLISAYSAESTRDPVAWEKLVRSYWYYDDGIRSLFFRFLSTTKLAGELTAARALGKDNPAATRFVAEAEAWRSHFEDAAPSFDALATAEPSNELVARRTAAINRSLSAFDSRLVAKAVAIEERLTQFDPRDSKPATTIGEMYADREEFDKARPYWNRIATIEPGKPDGYLEAATVFWDYFLYDDALRLMAEGRKKLGKPALYAYEAGAVYENKRDYASAISEYIKGAEAGSAARSRLIQLARRPSERALIDKLTAAPAAAPNPAAAAVSLRAAILESQNRRDDLIQLLNGVAGRTDSLELLETVREMARTQGLDAVEVRAVERSITVATDPVERMRLRLALMRLHEGRGQTAQAKQSVDALYAEAPAILGVVRATTDFYWRNKMERQSVDVLLRAAGAANANLKKQFTLEAARKSTEMGDVTRARPLLAGLLQAEPFKAEYLAAMADTYAKQNDDRGLREFYAAKIREVPDVGLRTSLRRGLIPALTRLKDYPAGVDQYIEIVKNYPEDDGVTREAALYASSHGVSARLLDYFKKAVTDSPRDYRWPLVMARLNVFFEDIPAAIASYAKAGEIRPDRADLLIARAALEERMMRFDEALRSYTKLYDLTYRDPQWMEKVAEIYARQGKPDAASKALRVALIEGRPERSEPFFDAARTLESWNMLAEARTFAERGVEIEGKDKIAANSENARTYVRILTRLRVHEPVFEWIANSIPADGDVSSAGPLFSEMAETVKTYFTPEEKAAFQGLLEKRQPSSMLIATAHNAGLADLEARWRFTTLMAGASSEENRYVVLQNRRTRFEDLARNLLRYWNAKPPQGRESVLLGAARAYRAGGDETGELSTLSMAQQRYGLDGDFLQRYLQLLMARDPQGLIAVAAGGGERGTATAEFAVASGNADVALRAVSARGQKQGVLWTKAYRALVGLYYANSGPSVESDFLGALGGGTIAERLGHPVDRTQQLAGSNWFYYGTAYGQYLSVKKKGDAEDYLPALLEGTPARTEAYAMLADYYRDNGDAARAVGDYVHALELDGDRGDIEDRLAEVMWSQNNRAEAVAHWKAAFKAFRANEDRRIAESFWGDVEHALNNVGQRKLLAEVRAEADDVLRTYVKRNGQYRVESLLRAAFGAASDAAAGSAWVVDLARSAQQPLDLYNVLAEAKWLPESQREPILQQGVAAAEAAASQLQSSEDGRQGEIQRWRLRWIEYLVDTKQTARARTAIDSLADSVRNSMGSPVTMLSIRVAAQGGSVAPLVEQYRRDPVHAPDLDTLRSVAGALQKNGDAVNARRVLEFVYSRELDQRNFDAANFLGLAEVRLEEGDTAAAVSILRRMTLVGAEPFQNLESAADLLDKYGRKAEARQFLETRVKAVPWDLGARAKLGDASVAAMPAATYQVRVRAAALKPSAKTGSGELDLLAAGTVVPAAAERPFFFQARVKAAASASDAETRLRLLRGALGIEPDDQSQRVALFRAAAASGKLQLAWSVMEPVIDSSGMRYQFDRTDSEEEALYSGYASGFASSDSERAAVSRELAVVTCKLGMLRHAEVFYRLALAIEPGDKVQTALAEVRAERKLRADEERRRPKIADGLEQQRLVRVRVQGGNSK